MYNMTLYDAAKTLKNMSVMNVIILETILKKCESPQMIGIDGEIITEYKNEIKKFDELMKLIDKSC